tara:strand:+ start:987 stop:1250 length:264 start_codon:yes stop_codon:yes gene_type:complete
MIDKLPKVFEPAIVVHGIDKVQFVLAVQTGLEALEELPRSRAQEVLESVVMYALNELKDRHGWGREELTQTHGDCMLAAARVEGKVQ